MCKEKHLGRVPEACRLPAGPGSYSPGSLPGKDRAGSGGLEQHRGQEPLLSLSWASAAVSVLLIPKPRPGPAAGLVPGSMRMRGGCAPRAPAPPAPPPAEGRGCAGAEPRAAHLLLGRCFQCRRSEAGSAWPCGFAPRPEWAECRTRQFCDGGDDACATLG